MSKDNDLLVRIGEFLQDKAKRKFSSNVEFANVANVDERTVRRILKGEQNLSINLLKQICFSLDVTLAELFTAVKS